MKPYNMLFYYSYLAGMKSHNFEGMPITAGLVSVIPNIYLHVITITFILRGFGCNWFDFILTKYGWMVFAIILMGLVYWYYSYHDRYKKIIERYNNGRDNFFKRHPFVVFIISMLCNIFLFIISAAFSNARNL